MVNDLLELKVRGYVAPEDFEGSDAERIQKALDLAKSADIAKVVLTGTYRADAPLTVPCGMHVVLDGATLYGDLQNEVNKNFSFEQDRIYVEGKNGKLVGNIDFCHTRHAVLENLRIDGNVSFRVSRDLRVEYVTMSGVLTVGRGCQNAIMQHITCRGVQMDATDGGYDIMGRERLIKNILLRHSVLTDGATLLAAEDCGFLNIQIDGICIQNTGVVLGKAGVSLPRELYKNLTFADIDAPEGVVLHNECLHAYIQ